MPQGRNFARSLRVRPEEDKLRQQRRKEAERSLINAESRLGRTVFGYIDDNYPRQFFCVEKNVWIWFEKGVTMRYEVRKNGVFKKVDNGKYYRIDGAELEHFTEAVKAYLKLIKTYLYN